MFHEFLLWSMVGGKGMCHKQEHVSDSQLEINKKDFLPPSFTQLVIAKDLARYWEIHLLFWCKYFLILRFSLLLQSQSTFIRATRILIFSHKSIPLAQQQILPLALHLWQYLSSKRSPRNKHHIPLVGLHRSRVEISSLQHSRNTSLCGPRWQWPFCCRFIAPTVPLSRTYWYTALQQTAVCCKTYTTSELNASFCTVTSNYHCIL